MRKAVSNFKGANMAHNIGRRRGRDLNQEWRIGAKHSLYREDGTWYHQLREFPGALIDAKGSKEVPTGTCHAILKAAGIRERD
jgi:hypothetical protein